MKLLYLFLLSVIIYQNCIAHPAEENTILEDTFIENGTEIENWYDFTNRTDSNDSYPEDMHGFGKKVVDKIKDKVKGVKDKIKDKVKTFKDKIGDGIDKVKEKLKNLKDKVGGGGGGGGNYRPYDRDNYRPYDRDNNRPYDRDYDKRGRYISGGGGGSGYGGSVGGTTVILIVLGIILGTGVVVGIVYYFANR